MCVCVIEITVKIVEREQLGRSGVSPAFDTGPGGGGGRGARLIPTTPRFYVSAR